MNKKIYLKTLLVAAGLCAGSMSALADGNKRTLYSENYELATDASDWVAPNMTPALNTGDATYGNYIYCSAYSTGNGNRSIVKTITSYAYDTDGKTTSAMETDGYVIEFDAKLQSGNNNGNSISQFVLATSNSGFTNNSTYSGTDYIFSLSLPKNTTGSYETTWYINDLTSSTGSTVTLGRTTWYHFTIIVTKTAVSYTIKHGNTQDATGSLTISAESLPKVARIWQLIGRGAGNMSFDNLDIYDYTNTVTVTSPTFTFNKVDGVKRNYTITNPDGSGTLYYTTAPAADAPAVGDAAYSSTTNTSVTLDYNESGKYYAYVLHTNGSTTSPVASQNVTAGALTLTTPVFAVTDMVQAADGFYYPVITFASDNSALEGTPTASFDISSPYTFTAIGSVTITASATGYTSSSSTFTVDSRYLLNKTIDFGALTASDFDGTIWTTATGAPRDLWTSRAAAIPADVTYYKLINTSSTEGSPDNSAVLDGITISNYTERVPEIYIGYGLLTPYTQVSGNKNYMNFTVNGGTADDYIVYNGWNNYGSGTFNTVQAGNSTFALYRYDTMLRTIKVFSPVPANETKSISAAGWATYCSPYALDLENATNLTDAYIVTGGAGGVLTKNSVKGGTVPANTGLLLNGTEGSAVEVTIPVVASSSTDVSDNKLLGVTSETVLDLDDNDDGTADQSVYVLMNETDGLGFYQTTTTSFTLGANTAYLPANFAGATARYFNLEDPATGINSVKGKEFMVNGSEIYNLQGQRVAQPAKGLYIINGKKVMVK